MRRIRNRLAFRLIFWLTLIVALVESSFELINVRIQETQLLEEVVRSIDQLSRGITSATWHAMLADRREAAYDIMRTIGAKQGIEDIRIFNKEGRVTFSTDPNAANQVDKQAEACFVCHAVAKPLVRVDAPSRARIFGNARGGRKMGMVTPIYNEPACSQAECHAHPVDTRVLGVLDITMDLDHVYSQVAGIRVRSWLMTGVAVLVIGVFIVFFVRRFVAAPIAQLIAGTQAVSAMELDRPIHISSPTELAELSASFNVMRERLKDARTTSEAFTQRLEDAVAERTRQLTATQEKLVRSDRLASLGQLAASVAHEINNPISGVLNLGMLMRRILRADGIPPGRVPDFQRYLDQQVEETARVGRIVSDLLSFSRRSTPQTKLHELNPIIERTLSLIGHKLELSGVRAEVALSPSLPPVHCDAHQIQQVVMNLAMNAAEAMRAGGSLSVRTVLDDDGGTVLLVVEDHGAGIAPEHLPRIFDPFFTSKEDGKGVGLGLAVAYGIVEAHGGTIDVKSELGVGTTFTVRLPVKPEYAA